jgi:hypothetical protein
MNSLDEVQSTCFQIPPTTEPEEWVYERPVVYCHQAFDLEHVRHISEVFSEDRGVYKMFVTLSGGNKDIKLEFKFDMRTTAIKAQRELWRAYTQTGEYAIVKRNKAPEEAERLDNSALGDS